MRRRGGPTCVPRRRSSAAARSHRPRAAQSMHKGAQRAGLGQREVKNYDGSWTEWGNLVEVPIETGA